MSLVSVFLAYFLSPSVQALPCPNFLSIGGLLTPDKFSEDIQVRSAAFSVRLQSDQTRFTVDAKYRLKLNKKKSLRNFLIPLHPADESTTEANDFCKSVKVTLDGKKRTAAYLKSKEGTPYCGFAIQPQKSEVVIELGANSYLLFDADHAKIDVDLLSTKWEGKIDNVTVDFDPGPFRGRQKLGSVEPTLNRQFLRDFGDPNVPISVAFGPDQQPKPLRMTLLLPGAQLAEKINTAQKASCQSPPERIAPVVAVEDESIGDETIDSGSLADQLPKVSAQRPGNCLNPLDSKSPAGARLKSVPRAILGLHAPSQPLNDFCQGPCPKSYYVRADANPMPAQVHIVGIYQNESQTVTVHVRKTAKPIRLVLLSYEPTKWKVSLESDAKLEKIYFGGFDKGLSKVESPLLGADVIRIPGELYMSQWEPEHSPSDDYNKQYLLKLQSFIGVKEQSFQGDYSGKEFVVPFYRDVQTFADREKKFQESVSRQRIEIPDGKLLLPIQLTPFAYSGGNAVQPTFSLGFYDLRTNSTGAAIRLAGPINSPLSPFAIDPDNQNVYMPIENQVKNLTTGQIFSVPSHLPSIQFITSVTFDSKRKRLIWIGHSGLNSKHFAMYFSPKTGKFGVLKETFRLLAMAYNPSTDQILALVQNNSKLADSLFYFSPELNPISALKLNPKLPSSSRPDHQIQAQMVNGKLVIVAYGGMGATPVLPTMKVAIDPICGATLDLL